MKHAIVFALLLATSLAAEPRPVTPADAKAIFEKLKAMDGTWKGKSTKGWTDVATYEVAAKGTVVIERSHFEGEENDGMMTTFFLDGERLLMTHYCEARNQPTLVAATIDDADHSVLFRFSSGTNMASRDVGHMDSCRMRFVEAGRVQSQWTWYAKGKETWKENIESVRSQ
jgi:hypothetical protein